MSTEEVKAKGLVIRNGDLAFLALRGPELLAKSRVLLPSDLRSALESNLILPGSWYPVAWYREMLRAFRVVTGERLELVRQIGAHKIRQDAGGVYKRLFMSLLSPQRLIGFSQLLFRNYWSAGTFNVTEKRAGCARAKVEGMTGWDENVFVDMQGGVAALLELAGAKEVRMRVHSGGKDGNSAIDMEAHWH